MASTSFHSAFQLDIHSNHSIAQRLCGIHIVLWNVSNATLYTNAAGSAWLGICNLAPCQTNKISRMKLQELCDCNVSVRCFVALQFTYVHVCFNAVLFFTCKIDSIAHEFLCGKGSYLCGCIPRLQRLTCRLSAAAWQMHVGGGFKSKIYSVSCVRCGGCQYLKADLG